MRAQQAALKKIANSKLRCLLAQKNSFNCANIAITDSVLFEEAQNRRISPRWRVLAKISGVEVAGVKVTFQGPTFKAARHCARKRLDEKDVREDEWHTTAHRVDLWTSNTTVCPDMAQAPVEAVDKPMGRVDPDRAREVEDHRRI